MSAPLDDLSAYNADLLAFEDEWRAAVGGGVIGLSCWNVIRNHTKLRQIDAKHAVRPDDPRVYSIAAYRRQRDAILREQLQRQMATDVNAEFRASIRCEGKLTDCFARHFPGLSPDEVSTVDTVPKLWAYVDQYLIHGRSVRVLTKGLSPRKAYAAELHDVYGIMHELRIDGTPRPPYRDMSEKEAEHELRAIANQLEKTEMTKKDEQENSATRSRHNRGKKRLNPQKEERDAQIRTWAEARIGPREILTLVEKAIQDGKKWSPVGYKSVCAIINGTR